MTYPRVYSNCVYDYVNVIKYGGWLCSTGLPEKAVFISKEIPTSTYSVISSPNSSDAKYSIYPIKTDTDTNIIIHKII